MYVGTYTINAMKTSAAVTMDSGLTGAKRETRIQIKAWSRSLWFGPHCWHLIYTFISRLKDKISPSQLTSLSSLLAWVLSGRESAIGQMGDSINYQCVTTNGSHLATLLLQRSALPISACFFFFLNIHQPSQPLLASFSSYYPYFSVRRYTVYNSAFMLSGVLQEINEQKMYFAKRTTT